MRALVQRVRSASVRVTGAEVASIGPGMAVLLGVRRGDGAEQAEQMAARLRALRIFAGADGRMNEPLGDREILCVSQLTLYADTSRGNRPGFADAEEPERAERLYELVCELLKARRGVFGAHMELELVNDGPVTVVVET